MAASGPVALQGVITPEIGGVRLKRHPIELEAARAMQIARRVGRRLVRWVRAVEGKEENLARVIGRDLDTGHEIREEILGDDGKPIRVPVLPDEDFRKNWDLYERTVRNMLIEQRARAAMAKEGKGGQPVDDATFNRQLQELARAAVLEMPEAELRALLQARAIDATSPNKASETTGTPARDPDGGDPVSEAATQSTGAPEVGGNGDFFAEIGGDDGTESE